jgi:hypothetical protein
VAILSFSEDQVIFSFCRLLGGQVAEPVTENSPSSSPAPGTIEELPSEPVKSQKNSKATPPKMEVKAPKVKSEAPKIAAPKKNADLRNDEVPDDLQLID